MSPAFRTNEPIESVPYGISVIPQNRLSFLKEKCEETLLKCPGSVIEVGVYKGGTLKILAELVKRICPSHKVFAIDTFRGHPYTDNHLVHPTGKYKDVSLTKLELYFNHQRLLPWIYFYKGKIEEIMPAISLPKLSFAHIDCDLYKPVKYCAANIPEKMKRGGLIYFDDYGHEHCPGATKAVGEVFSKGEINKVFIQEDNTCWSCFINM